MASPELDAYRELRDPREIKAFADPLRLRTLHVLIERPATNQQVAAELREPPAKVFHHLRFLLDAGLIRLVDVRINGKNVEKFYRSVARGFILRPGPDHLPETRIAALGAEIDRVRHAVLGSAAAWEDQPPRVLRRSAALAPDRLEAFEEKLRTLIREYWVEIEDQTDEFPRSELTVLIYSRAPAAHQESHDAEARGSHAE